MCSEILLLDSEVFGLCPPATGLSYSTKISSG